MCCNVANINEALTGVSLVTEGWLTLDKPAGASYFGQISGYRFAEKTDSDE